MLRKPTIKEAIAIAILALLAGIVICYVVVCLFFLVIGIVADHIGYFTIGIVGFGAPMGIPLIIHDIKDILF